MEGMRSPIHLVLEPLRRVPEHRILQVVEEMKHRDGEQWGIGEALARLLIVKATIEGEDSVMGMPPNQEKQPLEA
jgi:hypothetical protein